jgi:hypothetical protein
MPSIASKIQSIKDTEKHIDNVRWFIGMITVALDDRAENHDKSKLSDPELDVFSEFGPKLKNTKYGSEEYNESLHQMGSALKHHYQNNRHHPEHFENGVSGMNIVDFVEMICDWKAASLRMKNGNFEESIDQNAKRFGLDPQVVSIIKNTSELLFR